MSAEFWQAAEQSPADGRAQGTACALRQLAHCAWATWQLPVLFACMPFKQSITISHTQSAGCPTAVGGSVVGLQVSEKRSEAERETRKRERLEKESRDLRAQVDAKQEEVSPHIAVSCRQLAVCCHLMDGSAVCQWPSTHPTCGCHAYSSCV